MRTDEGVMIPRRATLHSAGYDFYAPHDIELRRGMWTDIGTGVYLEDGDIAEFTGESARFAMLLLPRSGLGNRYGVRLANTVGLIDQDYRGEIMARMTCEVDRVVIKAQERFMQGVIIPYGVLQGEVPPNLTRGTGGFGSTGQ